jgi:tetratricopeptide (TPR) repeat protein
MAPDPSLTEEIRRFEDQYRSQPGSLVFARLADAYRKAGEPERALEVLQEGLARHPDYPSGHIVNARTLQDLGRLDEAASAFRRVLQLDAQNLVAVRELARSADERGDLAEARHWFERLIQVDPTSEQAGDRLAELEIALEARKGQDAAAIAPEGRGADRPDPEPSARDVSDEVSGDGSWWEGPDEPPGTEREFPIDEAGPEHQAVPDSETEAVEAILNGEVPHSIRAEDTWWYEDHPTDGVAEASPDADLLTRTMADLYAEQGLYREAADIYEELLRDSPDDDVLRGRLEELRARMSTRGSEDSEGPARAGSRRSRAVREVAEDETVATVAVQERVAPAPIDRPAGVPVTDALRRLLRLGEERAAGLEEPSGTIDGSGTGGDDALVEEPLHSPGEAGAGADSRSLDGEAARQSDFTADWLRGLGRDS